MRIECRCDGPREIEVRYIGVLDDIYTVSPAGEVSLDNDLSESAQPIIVKCSGCGAERTVTALVWAVQRESLPGWVIGAVRLVKLHRGDIEEGEDA